MIDSAASGAECLPIECLINVGDVNVCDLVFNMLYAPV